MDGVLRAVVVTGQAIRATAIMLPAWWQSDELMRGMRRYSFLLTTVSLVALTEKSQSRFLIFAIGFFCIVCFFFLRIHHHLNCVLRADELAGQPLHILGSDLLQGFTVRQHVIRLVAHAFGEGGHPESIGGAVGGVLFL